MVVRFEDPNFTGEVLSELRRLKDADLLRVVDLVVVAKDADGEVAAVEMSDLSDEERAQFGAVAGALIGLGMEGDEEGSRPAHWPARKPRRTASSATRPSGR